MAEEDDTIEKAIETYKLEPYAVDSLKYKLAIEHLAECRQCVKKAIDHDIHGHHIVSFEDGVDSLVIGMNTMELAVANQVSRMVQEGDKLIQFFERSLGWLGSFRKVKLVSHGVTAGMGAVLFAIVQLLL